MASLDGSEVVRYRIGLRMEVYAALDIQGRQTDNKGAADLVLYRVMPIEPCVVNAESELVKLRGR